MLILETIIRLYLYYSWTILLVHLYINYYIFYFLRVSYDQRLRSRSMSHAKE